MWIIYIKELLELARDRRTFFFTVFIPVFAMPLILTGFGYVSSTMFKQASQAEMAYSIFGKDQAPHLAERFAKEKGFREVVLASPADIKAAIGDDRIKFALVIPAGFEASLARQQQGVIALHYNSAATVDLTRKRVMSVIGGQNRLLREQALSALNLNQEQLRFALDPITLEDHSTADKREQMGAVVGGMLPYILLMVCLLAAMYPAIDTGAGEKERGTLETLLLAPVSRSALVMAKFLMLFTVGLTSALLMIASMGVLLTFFGPVIGSDLAQMVRAIGPLDLAMVALMLVPTAAIFAAILLSISVYAKSYKEAAGLISPLILVTVMPTLVALLPGVELNWKWAMVPLTNVSLAMKELVKGTMDYSMFWVILLSTTLTAGALLAVCRWWFNREQVLFRN
ncbi:ABC transporter permease [Duganella sp. BJB488]|uniref:ABC transporter permease n=1 Tax=unclassified Duganella TaxID=2636909 RepID=UPI000E346F66|nr:MULTISPECIES: ABC transporter permease [unclassified Duganella]RFP22777.1 ABC transporter permease [Duganella sp. BJB489]RFP25149.1 ABC transporter permease [Duganella sp. BJB488]RFP33774.1 ABC transporter permease [Duganella sp. BJB480]